MSLTSYDKSWNRFFDDETIDLLYEIDSALENLNYNPNKHAVLRFFSFKLTDVKIVILGQDPYPQPGVATGRAFEAKNLKSWNHNIKQASLRNIIKLLYKSYHRKLLTFSEIRQKIQSSEFLILPPSEIFTYWEKQGVLLLNAYFTCEVNKPKSHRLIWREFTEKLLAYMSKTNDNIIWFLWGYDAISFEKNIKFFKKLYKSNHPMILRKNNPNDFSSNLCFKETSNLIDWLI